MENVKQHGLTGIGSNVELGKDGPRLKITSDIVEIRNQADNAYAQLRSADPTADQDVVTKRYLETRANVIVTVQIDGGAPGTPSDGVVGIVTTAGGTYNLKELYRGESSAWVELTVVEGMVISITDALSGGTDTYLADHRYIWDADASTWGDIGPAVSVSGVVKSARASLAYDTTSPLNIGDPVPANARTMFYVVAVTQAFNGTAPTLKLGDSGDDDRLATIAEIDLKTTGSYCGFCPHLYGSQTQLQAVYVADSSSAGAAALEITYSIP